MIDLDKVVLMRPQDGDVFALPADAEYAHDFVEALRTVAPSVKCSVVLGNIAHLSESDMNDAGWYRKENPA